MKHRCVIYTSQAVKQLNKRNLLDILHESRAYNTIDNITGVLMHRKGYFLQVLEGDTDAITNLLSRLQRDSRHHKIKILLDNYTNSRLFPNWAMGCADFDEPELSCIPGVRTDLNDPEVIQELTANLPEIASFLNKKLH
ncbi:MAG: BLUF domain-containing protein [Flavobacteriales bacterium]|nr:BLUF domain-containing protein [Flavobacteriales bacterium]